MTKTSKTLKLIFKNDHHKVSTLSLPYASVNLPEAEVNPSTWKTRRGDFFYTSRFFWQ